MIHPQPANSALRASNSAGFFGLATIPFRLRRRSFFKQPRHTHSAVFVINLLNFIYYHKWFCFFSLLHGYDEAFEKQRIENCEMSR